MLLERLLQHEVSNEYEMCRGLKRSWKLMDWCRVLSHFQLRTHDVVVDFFVAEIIHESEGVRTFFFAR